MSSVINRVALCLALSVVVAPGLARALEITLSLSRASYRTDEKIPLALVRSAAGRLSPGDVEIAVTSAGADSLEFVFAVPGEPGIGGRGVRTEHLAINANYLRPGRYTIRATADGDAASVDIELFASVQATSYALIDWTRATAEEIEASAREGYGFNLLYDNGGKFGPEAAIRAGASYMRCCTMSGGHQMDLRMECDWSDPYVLGGATQRVVRQAFADRTAASTSGVHLYDEPGLTWHKDPATGKTTPHTVPAQRRAYRASFGTDPIRYDEVRPDVKDDRERWAHWSRWKLSFMDAAWKQARFGVQWVRPDFLAPTQSQYGWTAHADGYYFNVTRSLSVASGHGGYDDYGLYVFNPSFHLEMARGRDFDRPCWYLPTWYGNISADQYRLETYLSFVTGIEGMMKPPDIRLVGENRSAASSAIKETNGVMGRLGTIFTTMPTARPPVAMLYSISNCIAAQTRDMNGANYGGGDHSTKLGWVYLASKQLRRTFLTVVDEDIVDGTVARHHRAVVLTGIRHLAPEVVAGLEAFAASGGMVLLTDDCTVSIRGGVKIGVPARHMNAEAISKARAAEDKEALKRLDTIEAQMESVRPIAAALRRHFDAAGIDPVFECDNDRIVAARHAHGDVEYLFALNAATDPAGTQAAAPVAMDTTIRFGQSGGTLYAVGLEGQASASKVRGTSVQLELTPGEMKVFARTARPIGGVKAVQPTVEASYTRAASPLAVRLGAVVTDRQGGVLAGSIPLKITLVDPAGSVRYALHRATDRGVFDITLPLAANDPAGEWKCAVEELITGTKDEAVFELRQPSTCGAAAGIEPRALWFGRDRDSVHRFLRLYKDVTIVVGNRPFHRAAAARLAEILAPWDVRAKIVDAESAARPRSLTAEEAATWCGMVYAGSGQIKPGDANDPRMSGFALRTPTIVLGTPEDNPLIAFMQREHFLPYEPAVDRIPGRGRGMVAWQRGAVNREQESIAVIAYTERGMAEAVGSLYEAATGLEPLTPLELPRASTIRTNGPW